MTSLHTSRGSLLSVALLVALILGAAAWDHDLLLAVPLALLLAGIFGVVAIFAGKPDRWPVYAMLGGAIGWIGSLAVLMNLEI